MWNYENLVRTDVFPMPKVYFKLNCHLNGFILLGLGKIASFLASESLDLL